ncbi:FAD-dependent oxidoreductase [Hydrogenoanaerobacterium sp.]|uniref:FAD-dependent oxidoreductase n=1 Tax=Hydrogenoanaerobacterium sp. TaxID=2953763 RepID=UPI00289D4321|nr:FAD-dependent oxidoreductase [Hydrogenoanaerobacterium sp.]
MGERLVVIGGTAAGLSAASKAKRTCSDMDITVYEKTGFVSYGSCGLPYFVGDMIPKPEDLVSLTVENLRDKRGIHAHINHEVTEIDRQQRLVKGINLNTGATFETPYDKLVIATGAVPIRPPITGIEAQGVHILRTVEHGIDIKEAIAKGAKRVVVVGGGFIGLEMAEQLTNAGVKVVLVEAMPRLLPVLPETYASIIQKELEGNGVEVILNERVAAIESEEGRVKGVCLSDGRRFEAEIVLLSTGAAPNSKLAADCGLELGLKGAIVVDDAMHTSDPNIFACGDCVQMRNIITGKTCYVPLGTTANKQGRVAGAAIAGEKASFPGVLGSQVTKIFDLYVAATGLSLNEALDAGYDAVSSSIMKGDRASYYPGSADNYITLVFERKGGRLLGAQGVGSFSVAGRMNVFVAAITAGMTVEQLNDLDLVYSPSVAPVYDPILIAASQALKKVTP